MALKSYTLKILGCDSDREHVLHYASPHGPLDGPHGHEEIWQTYNAVHDICDWEALSGDRVGDDATHVLFVPTAHYEEVIKIAESTIAEVRRERILTQAMERFDTASLKTKLLR